MVVDCHTHVNFIAGDTELSEHLDASAAVDFSIVHAMCNGPSEDINKQLADYVTTHADRMVGFAYIDPREDKVAPKAVKAQTLKLGLKGLVQYCCESGQHPTHSLAMQLYEAAEGLGLPVYFHNDDGFLAAGSVLEYAQPYMLDEIARTFENLKIVIGSMGMPFLEQTLAMIGKHENVYADLTVRPGNVWQVYNTVVSANERGVMHKLLFGSGFPTGRAWECMETLLGFNMLLADTNLPTVPRSTIRSIVERDTLDILEVEHKLAKSKARKPEVTALAKQEPEG